MGRFLILNKDPDIIADFQNRPLFAHFDCATLHEDEQHYYITLIPSPEHSPAYEPLMQHLQPHVVSIFEPSHGSSRQPTPDNTYLYTLARFPIVHLTAVQQFYIKHHSKELDELMLSYCRRYIDFDFIDTEQQSLFVFAKNIDSQQPLPPIEQFPGADQYPEFLADLHELVTHHLQAPAKLSLLACLDNQHQAKQFSPAFFRRKQESTPTHTTSATTSYQP